VCLSIEILSLWSLFLATPCIGFSEIMATLSRIGLFNNEAHPTLKNEERPTFRKFMFDLLKIVREDPDGALIGEEDISERILTLGHCKEQRSAMMTAKTIM
jgi:alpha-aminoadipic semialdehyde synthase